MADITAGTFGAVILLASISVVAAVIGVALALKVGGDTRQIGAGIGFSAGIMLLISFIELIPESASTGGAGQTLVAVLLGMGLVAAAHLVVPHTHLVDESDRLGSRSVRTTYLVAFGLVLHDFPEGIAMANSYVASPSLGVLTALAIAVHNIPEEFAIAAPAALARRRRLMFGAAVVSSMAEPLGAVVGLVIVTARPSLNAWFLGFAAGAMVFVSLHELLPLAREHGRLRYFALGSALSVPVYLAIAGLTTALA